MSNFLIRKTKGRFAGCDSFSKLLFFSFYNSLLIITEKSSRAVDAAFSFSKSFFFFCKRALLLSSVVWDVRYDLDRRPVDDLGGVRVKGGCVPALPASQFFQNRTAARGRHTA